MKFAEIANITIIQIYTEGIIDFLYFFFSLKIWLKLQFLLSAESKILNVDNFLKKMIGSIIPSMGFNNKARYT